MKISHIALAACLAPLLAACGGDDNGSTPTPTPPVGGTPSSPPTSTPGTAGCSLADRKAWAADVIDQTYLFPDLLAQNVNPASYGTVQSYIDALVAPARAQDKDRYFTYITSIEEEQELINSGTNAGFGFRLFYDTSNQRLFVLEAFENAPAFQKNIDRGTEITAIGTSTGNLQSVSSLFASGGAQAVANALGPSTPGTTRVLEIRNGSMTSTVSVTKTEYSLDPLSDRYGVKIINDGGRQIGYINLRTFIVADASNQLRQAFGQLRSAGVTEVIVDYRYNGGGLVSVAEVMADLLARSYVDDVFARVTFRPSRSDENSTDLFGAEANAIAATKIAFIGFGGTASASELVINAFVPYLDRDMALVGSNTFGKPVGQEAYDRAACDDRLRVVAFKLENADGEGEYFQGLATTVPVTCRAEDDYTRQLGDPREASVAKSIDFIKNGPSVCAPITAGSGGIGTRSVMSKRAPLQPALEDRTAAQHEIPGLF